MACVVLTHRRPIVVTWSFVGLLLLAGCSGTPAKTVSVDGKLVDASGAPVKGADIALSPNGKGFAATGKSGEDGTFQLSTFEENDGVPVGDYTVAVTDANEVGLPISGSETIKIEPGQSELVIKVEAAPATSTSTPAETP